MTKILIIVYIACSLNAFAHSEKSIDPTESRFQLSMSFKGANIGDGTLMIAVFDEGSAFPNGKPFKTLSISGKEEKNAVVQMNLPKGTYAVAVFLDVNNNSKLDSNMFSYPTEPYGFSNNAKGSFGPPDFKAASIMLDADMQIEISLN